jgi:hypothetical protein
MSLATCTRFHRIGQEPILQSEREALNAENAGSFTGLPRTHPRFSELGWLAIGEIDQQNPLSFIREFG